MPNTATTTASPNPTAQANASLSANANIPAGQAGSPWTAAPVTQAPGTGTGVPTNTSTPQASTTVQSNDNTINNTVPAIQNTTNNLANTSGVSTNSSGQPTYSNGTLVQPPAGETYVNGQLTYTGTNGTGTNNNISPNGTLITGGYIGDTYYAPGTLAANIPTDANGQPQQLSSQGSTDSQILQNLQTAKSQADSLTASLIDSITSQYNSLIQNQQQANNSQQASVGHSLIKEGTSQLDPIGAAQVTQAQVSYGLSQIASLQSKEQSAIIQAQQAGQDEDFKLMDDMNTEAQSVRTEQQAAAQKILDAVSAVNAAAAANKLQASNDDFVTKELQAGITDPQQILADAQKAGNTDLTAKQVADSIAALSPTADELNRQQAAIQFAVTNGVTQPYYLVGNTAIDTKTGLPVTLQQYQAATGQSGKSEADTNFSQIQQLASPDVKNLMDKYPDAGINPTDTSQQALAKLDNSAIYRKETYIAPSAATTAAGLAPELLDAINGSLNTYNGTSYLTSTDLTGLSADQKAAIMPQLLANGTKILSPKDGDAISSINAAKADISDLQLALQTSTITPKGFMGRPIAQAQATLGSLFQVNNSTALQTFNASVIPLLTALKGAGSGGGGSSRLFSTIGNLLPTATDTVSVANGKIKALNDLLDNGGAAIMGQYGNTSSSQTVTKGTTGTINGKTYIYNGTGDTSDINNWTLKP